MSCAWKSKERHSVKKKKNSKAVKKMQRSDKVKMIPSVPTDLGFILQPGYITDIGSLGYLSFFPINSNSNWLELAPFTYCKKN